MDRRTLDRHSVGCYFCGILFDERNGSNADEYNGNDGGSICPGCLKKSDKARNDALKAVKK